MSAEYLSRLKSLRKEKENLKRELNVLVVGEKPSYHNPSGGVGKAYDDRGMADARYARALRIQQIDREIDTLKRENIVRIQ